MLTLNNVSAGYGGDDIIKNISLTLAAGESLAIIGPNGCGKTTLLRTIANLLPFSGDIKLAEKSLRNMKRREIATHIAMLSQISGIYFSYSIFDTVMMGRYPHIKDNLLGMPSATDKEQVLRCLETVGLIDEKDRDITTLSGGQLQRVFLARTLAQEPQILLLDEPTNHLDLKYQAELVEHLKNWATVNKRAVIGVFHDINLALRLSNKLLVMKDGRIEALGTATEIVNSNLLEHIYEMDVAHYMQESLKIWQGVV